MQALTTPSTSTDAGSDGSLFGGAEQVGCGVHKLVVVQTKSRVFAAAACADGSVSTA